MWKIQLRKLEQNRCTYNYKSDTITSFNISPIDVLIYMFQINNEIRVSTLNNELIYLILQIANLFSILFE